MREAVGVEGGQDEGRRSPPAVPPTYPSVDVVEEGSLVTWEKEGGGAPFFFYNSVVIGGGGGGEMDGGESLGGLHQLHQLLTIADCPLRTKRSGDGRAKGKGLTCRVQVEDGRGGRV